MQVNANGLCAREFYCSNPDGSLIDRAAFLKQTAQPVAIKNLKAEDVLIRCRNLKVEDIAQTAPLLEIWQGAQDRLYSRLFQS